MATTEESMRNSAMKPPDHGEGEIIPESEIRNCEE